MFRFLRWLFGFKEQDVEVKVGIEFEVYSDEDAIEKAVEMCAKSGKVLIGNIDWNKDGTGKMKITQVQDSPKE